MKIETTPGMTITWKLGFTLRLIGLDKESATFRITGKAYGKTFEQVHRLGFDGEDITLYAPLTLALPADGVIE